MKGMRKGIALVLLLTLCAFGAAAETLVLPKELVTIEANAFYGTALDEVVLQSGVKEIGSKAFASSSIKSITIPASVTVIEHDAFDDVTDLEIIAPEGSTAQSYAEEDEQKNRGFKYTPGSSFESVFFGRYPQGANGEEQPIEWYVLEKANGKALLLSKYCLDRKQYHPDKDGTGSEGWSNSSLRTWMNSSSQDGFLGKAFNPQERSAISYTDVDYGSSQDNPSNSLLWSILSIVEHRTTRCYVFALSYLEAQQYFPEDDGYNSNPQRAAKATAYVRKQAEGVSYSGVESDGTCSWWLRSLGPSSDTAGTVRADGNAKGYLFQNATYPVRPAMWVSLDALQ